MVSLFIFSSDLNIDYHWNIHIKLFKFRSQKEAPTRYEIIRLGSNLGLPKVSVIAGGEDSVQELNSQMHGES